uniref:NB-ARC domain-containing protein n=1 Tax=Triticum urartu TaxID=4572 RepID=A0A8R7R787_TRIUA
MKPLSTADSKILFHQRIFGKGEKCSHKQLVEVSEKILMKCGGVPLAIITISSLLAERNDSAHWSKVYQSMGTGLENNPDVNDMRRILYVSYYYLPPHLKICLLFLSLYPEDCKFKRKYLIWKWVGEGFIQPEQGKSLYEVGEEYFDELINQSSIQPVSSKWDLHSAFSAGSKKKASYCRLHDMVLDLITCLSREENFMTTLGGQQYESVPGKIRRLSLHTSKQEDAKVLSTMNMSHVRSLTVFRKSFSPLPTLSSFPLLSALDLTNCKQVDDRHFMLICNMFHLRYLWL